MTSVKKKNIDALFPHQLKNYEYHLSDEANWYLTKKLMEQRRKKRKIRIFRITGSFFLLLSAASLLYLFYLPKNQQTTNILTTIPDKHKFQSNPSPAVFSSPSIQPENSSKAPTLSRSKGKVHPLSNLTSHPANLHLPVSSSSENTVHNTLKKDSSAGSNVPASVSSETMYPDALSRYIESSAETFYITWNTTDSVKVQIHPCIKEINSPYPDYAPVINADGTEMYFTSRRIVSSSENKKKKNTQMEKENIYYSRFDPEKQKWTDAEILPPPINQPDRFNSAVALSNDGQTLFIYRDDADGNGDIYEVRKKGLTWSEPQKLPEPINSKYHESSISVSPDGNTIYFTSNRPGGAGGMDIWYCVKDKNGKWNKAINLKEINTDKDEEGVFMHPDGKTLYFSSRGYKGLGGYDIYYTRLENNRWINPLNLGAGINTKDDDVYFVVEANGKNAYYATVRKDGIGEKDIYRLTFLFPENKKNTAAQLTLFKGNILDKKENRPLQADIELIDLDKNERITVLQSNEATGSFMISLPAGKNYAINVRKEGYLFYSENFNIPSNDTYKEVHKTILLEKLAVGAKIVLKNIFYDYDKATLRPESKTELDKLYELLLSNPALKVELSAHTDSRGSDEYNLKLSQQRAQSCVDYLISKGIAKERIIAKGYGEQQPLVPDSEIFKLSSEEEKEKAHQQNRRTEIKILENNN
ncbi:MAG: hypothetical protein D6799_06730 [Bacteroidetes bacterium]|nr:MAG: hypothetical protein D6799_06730 [Bacteroidota bacterium]